MYLLKYYNLIINTRLLLKLFFYIKKDSPLWTILYHQFIELHDRFSGPLPRRFLLHHVIFLND